MEMMKFPVRSSDSCPYRKRRLVHGYTQGTTVGGHTEKTATYTPNGGASGGAASTHLGPGLPSSAHDETLSFHRRSHRLWLSVVANGTSSSLRRVVFAWCLYSETREGTSEKGPKCLAENNVTEPSECMSSVLLCCSLGGELGLRTDGVISWRKA